MPMWACLDARGEAPCLSRPCTATGVLLCFADEQSARRSRFLRSPAPLGRLAPAGVHAARGGGCVCAAASLCLAACTGVQRGVALDNAAGVPAPGAADKRATGRHEQGRLRLVRRRRDAGCWSGGAIPRDTNRRPRPCRGLLNRAERGDSPSAAFDASGAPRTALHSLNR